MGGAASGGAPSGAFAGATPGGNVRSEDRARRRHQARRQDEEQGRSPATSSSSSRASYEEGATGAGTPLAVKKLTADKFPLKFSLDSRDAMLAGTTLAGKVVVTVRVDKDGDAITKNPGDVTGQTKPVEPPRQGCRHLARQGALMKGWTADLLGLLAQGVMFLVGLVLSLVVGMVLGAHLDGAGRAAHRHRHLRRGPPRRRRPGGARRPSRDYPAPPRRSSIRARLQRHEVAAIVERHDRPEAARPSLEAGASAQLSVRKNTDGDSLSPNSRRKRRFSVNACDTSSMRPAVPNRSIVSSKKAPACAARARDGLALGRAGVGIALHHGAEDRRDAPPRPRRRSCR